MLLNDNIVDIKKPDEICSLTFVVDKSSELFLHPPFFSIKNSRLVIKKYSYQIFGID